MIQTFIDKELQQYMCNHCQRVFYIPSRYTAIDDKFFLKDNFGCPYCNYNTHPNVGIKLREIVISTYQNTDMINFLNPERRKEYGKELKERGGIKNEMVHSK